MSDAPASTRPALWRRAASWLFRREPFEVRAWEGFVMRLLFAVLVLRESFPPFLKFTTQPKPNGLAHWFDFTFLGDPSTCHALWVGWNVALVLYVLGLAMPLTLGYLVFCSVSYGTLGNSQGWVGHTFQGVTLVIVAQWFASLWSLVRCGWKRLLFSPERAVRLEVYWTQQMLVAAYTVSAVSKLIGSRGRWMWETPLFGLQIRKSTEQDYYNSLTGSLTENQGLAQALIDHPWLARLVISPALPLELCFCLALLNRRIAAVYGLLIIFFHTMVTEMMRLGFAYNKQMLFIFFCNAPFWIVVLVRRFKPEFPLVVDARYEARR